MTTGLDKFAKDEGSNILALVRERMDVLDANGDRIGRVRNLYMGAGSEEVLKEGRGPATASVPPDTEHTLLDDFARALGGDVDMPETLRNRLLREGYIRI